MLDIVIVGSGPAGLAAAITAKAHGLSYVVLEMGVLADTVYKFPVSRRLFSTADELELKTGYLDPGWSPTREDLLRHYSRVTAEERLNVRLGECASRVVRTDEGFIVATDRCDYKTQTVIAAVGGFGRARRLDVPGESRLRVSYRFVDPYAYVGKSVLVLGGGNSAAEAALSLAEAGSAPTLAVRRRHLRAQPHETSFGSPIKPWVLGPLEEAASQGVIKILTACTVMSIDSQHAILRINEDDNERIERVECDHIFALIGADPDTGILKSAGAEIAKDGRPVYDSETYETTIGGLYVSGHLTRERHIKNAVEISRRVVAHIFTQLSKNRLVGLEVCV